MYNDEEWLRKVIEDATKGIPDFRAGSGNVDLDAFRGVTRSLVRNALNTLDEIISLYKSGKKKEELGEKLSLLYHHLDYLKRLCEGEV